MTDRTYTLIAGPDREVLGPYPTEAEARWQAERFEEWEIIDDREYLIDEKKSAKTSDEAVVPH